MRGFVGDAGMVPARNRRALARGTGRYHVCMLVPSYPTAGASLHEIRHLPITQFGLHSITWLGQTGN